MKSISKMPNQRNYIVQLLAARSSQYNWSCDPTSDNHTTSSLLLVISHRRKRLAKCLFLRSWSSAGFQTKGCKCQILHDFPLRREASVRMISLPLFRRPTQTEPDPDRSQSFSTYHSQAGLANQTPSDLPRN